jgi:hypothetical protein
VARFFQRRVDTPVLRDLQERLERHGSRIWLLRFRLSLMRLTLRAARTRTRLNYADPVLRETARLMDFIWLPQTPWEVQHQQIMRTPPIHWGPKLSDVWAILRHVRILPFGEPWARWLKQRLPS